jgi:hypothetical protein
MKNSNKPAIRVVKKKWTEPVETAARPATNHSISVAVDNWIQERSNNRKVETMFSTDNIRNWQSRQRP